MNSPSPKATRREWIGLAVLALPCLLATMDLTVLNLAVPHLSAELNPTSSQLLWIVDIYGFMIAGALITMGTLGDRIGRRRLLLIGAAAFGLASTIAAFSKTAEMLIVTRALQGIAGATLAPSTLSLIRNMFLDAQQRTVAVGVWMTCFSVGAAIGPLLGGVLLEHFWWGSVFLLNVPVMALLLVLGPILLPEYRDPAARRLDIASAVMSLAAVLSAIYGLKHTAETGLDALALAAIAMGGIIGAVFLRRQRKLADPLIDLNLFTLPAFAPALAINALGCFIAFGVFLFTAQYLQLVLGLSPLRAGLWTTPSSLGFILGAMVTPAMSRRFSPSILMTVGFIVAALGLAWLTKIDATKGLFVLVSGVFVYSLGLAPVFTLATDILIGSAPPERSGTASSISETGCEFGGALGIAIMGSIGTAMYRREIADMLPSTLTPEMMDTARNTLGGAAAVAASLPVELGNAVLEPARAVFCHALQAIGWLSAALALALAAIAWFKVKPSRHPQ